MKRYIARRLLQLIPVALLVTFLTFSLVLLLPGDPVQAIIGPEAAPPEVIAALRHQYGLDRPIHVQYAMWLNRVLHGDLGRSFRGGQKPVLENILRRAPVTFQLALVSFALAVVVGIPVGIVSAVRRNSKLDIAGTIFAMGGVALPHFWLGIMLVLLFGLVWRLLPPGGFVSMFDDPLQGLKFLILPSLTLSTGMMATYMRQTRSAMLEVMAEDYIRTARAKGLKEVTVLGTHALKNALLPVVTVIGLTVARFFGGSVIVEQIFAIPGMGRLAVEGLIARDLPVVQGVVLMIALMVILANLLTDITYAYLDPRIKYD